MGFYFNASRLPQIPVAYNFIAIRKSSLLQQYQHYIFWIMESVLENSSPSIMNKESLELFILTLSFALSPQTFCYIAVHDCNVSGPHQSSLASAN